MSIPKISILFLFLLMLLSPRLVAAQNFNYLTETTYKTISDSGIVYKLPHKFIYPQSENVYINHILQQRNKGYVMDYFRGEITFAHHLPDSSKIVVRYRYRPIDLQLTYRHREPTPFVDSLGAEPLSAYQKSRQRRDIYTGTTLDVGGSKTIGISVGSDRDMSLEQSLRVNVFGKISQDITVNAVLSDQSTPLQPEGTTEEIQELDRVFVEAEGKNFSVILGDYDLKLQDTEFANYTRKLQGVKGEIFIRDYHGLLSGAISKGKFRSQTFFGQDGKQGPYQLTGENGETDIVVIGGSENIWLNGERLRRGESNDYTIEYGSGEITFTSRRIIDSDSRIVVDFEYTTQQYKRSLYTATANAKLLNETLNFSTTFIYEADDKDDPLSLVLTEDYKAHLQMIGDKADSNWISGGEYEGENEGNYRWNGNYFVYAGADSADYDVKFTKVAYGDGDYSYIGSGAFEYVGDGNGDFVAQIQLPLPERKMLSDVKISYDYQTHIKLESELAISHWDKNTFSDKDDEDNVDWAGVTNLYVSPTPTKLGRIKLKGTFRQVNEDFESPGRIVAAEYFRDWGFIDRERNQEKVYQINSQYTPYKRLTLDGFLGKLSSGEKFASIRKELGVHWNPAHFPIIRYDYKTVNSEQDSLDYHRTFHQAHTEKSFWILTPEFDGEYERVKSGRSDALADSLYWLAGGGISIINLKPIQLTAYYSYRSDKKLDEASDEWIEKSISKTQKYNIGIQNWHSVNVSGEYHRKRKEYKAVSGTNARNDLVQIRFNHSPLERAISTNIYYTLNNTATRQKREHYAKVEEGFGDYSYDESTHQYYLDPEHGSYIKETILQPDLTLVSDLTTDARFNLYFDKLFEEEDTAEWKQLLSIIGLTSEIRLSEESTEEDVLKLALLQPSKLQKDSTTIYGKFFSRQDLEIMRRNTDLSLRLRYEISDTEDNQSLNIWRERSEENRALRIRSSYWDRLSLETNLEWEHQNEIQENDVGAVIYQSDSEMIGIKGQASYQPNSNLEFTLKSGYEKTYNSQPVYGVPQEFNLNQYYITPGVNFNFRRSFEKHGRVSADLKISYLAADKPEDEVPYTLLGNERLGTTFEWRIDSSYYFNKNVMGNLNYSATARPNETVRHLGRMEIRAYF